MALIVETGVGITGADSFASVAEADAFWAGRPSQGADWLALTTPRKEECLRDATDLISMRLTSGTAIGGLPWPWVDVDVIAFDLSRIKRATILAADVARLGPLVGGAAQGGRVTSESKALGPLSKSVSYSDRPLPASANGRDLTFIDDMLRGITSGGGLIIGRTARA